MTELCSVLVFTCKCFTGFDETDSTPGANASDRNHKTLNEIAVIIKDDLTQLVTLKEEDYEVC